MSVGGAADELARTREDGTGGVMDVMLFDLSVYHVRMVSSCCWLHYMLLFVMCWVVR